MSTPSLCEALRRLMDETAGWGRRSRVAEVDGEMHARLASALALAEEALSGPGSSAADSSVGERQGRQPGPVDATLFEDGPGFTPADRAPALVSQGFPRAVRAATRRRRWPSLCGGRSVMREGTASMLTGKLFVAANPWPLAAAAKREGLPTDGFRESDFVPDGQVYIIDLDELTKLPERGSFLV